MKTKVITPSKICREEYSVKPSLYLEPHDESDEATLRYLIREFTIIGCGNSPTTGQPIHVELPLVPGPGRQERMNPKEARLKLEIETMIARLQRLRDAPCECPGTGHQKECYSAGQFIQGQIVALQFAAGGSDELEKSVSETESVLGDNN